MATIFGKVLKGIGNAAKAVGKTAAKAANTTVGKVVIGAGSALGLGGILGAIAPKLAGKVSTVLTDTKVGQMVSKVAESGTVLNSKIDETLKAGGVNVSSSDVNEISKALADQATQQSNAIIIRDKTSADIDESTDLKVKELNALIAQHDAAVAAGDQTKLEKIAATAAILTSSLKAVAGSNPKVMNVLNIADKLLNSAPQIAQNALETYAKAGESPSLDGSGLSMSSAAKTEIFTGSTVNTASMFDSLKNINPIVWVLAGIAAFFLIIKK